MKSYKGRLSKAAIWSTLSILAVFPGGCTSNSTAGDSSTRQGPAVRLIQASAESQSSTAPADKTNLGPTIDSQIDSGEFASARWGVFVLSLKDGRVLYARNADRLFTPASNMKIYTTTVALDLLGSDYRWRTSVYAETPPDAAGTIKGDLVLYGRGAPDLAAESKGENKASLAQLADDLYQRGLRRVQGRVVGDESYFRGEPLGDGWQWTDLQWYFGAEPSALTINNNEVDVSVLPPARSDATPEVIAGANDYVTVQNRMATVKHGERLTVGINRGLSDNNIQVWGTFPEGTKAFGVRLSVHNPALWAANLFLKALKARGIAVDGGAGVRDSRIPPAERFDPQHSSELAFVLSRSLGEIVKATNKESLNLDAELILRTLGRERAEMLPPADSNARERGDDEAGTSLVLLWLTRAGISTAGLAIHDGSGLSRLDLVTPESTARLLAAISKTSSGGVFRDSLPLSGRDGTLGGRLMKIQDRVSAKTGTLTYDNSLSGYLTTAEGEILAFSIMCNDQTGTASSTRVIDEIVSTLAAYPQSERPKP